jgi:hypothetical protein
MPHFGEYLKPCMEKQLSEEKQAELKRLRIANEVAKGPPYPCLQSEGKRMNIQQGLKA